MRLSLTILSAWLIFLNVVLAIDAQQQQQIVLSYNDNEDLNQQQQQSLTEQDFNNEEITSGGITGLLSSMLKQVQEINGKIMQTSNNNICLPQGEREQFESLIQSNRFLVNITKALQEEMELLKKGEGCNRRCRDLQQEQISPSSTLAKQVECLRRGANLQLKKLVTGTFYYDKVKKVNFLEAKEFCDQHGLQLATLDTLGKAQEVYTAGAVGSHGYWVGANDINQASGDYRWISNGNKVHHEMWWKAGYPRAFKVGQETCVLVWGNLLWDHPCTVKDRYILCEMPAECHNLLYKFSNSLNYFEL